MNLRQAAQQALEALANARDFIGEEQYKNPTKEWNSWQQADELQQALLVIRAALAEPEQEPVATNQMLRWVERLKRLSDDGQHMSIPGLSSGACWELAIELEQFIKNTAPTPQPEQKSWFTVEELNEFATKLKEKAWK